MSKATTTAATPAASTATEASKIKAPPTKEEIIKFHGYMCVDKNFPLPPCTYHNPELARKNYTDITRSEYTDTDEVLDAKAEMLIQMFKKAEHASVFVGAGIEVSCGTPDYASHDRSAPKVKLPTIELSPSPAHRVLASMFNSGNFKFASGRCFVQQNHSCMFERAGVDFNRVNNMHGVNLTNPEGVKGALGKEVNPVVKMSGTLREDLFADILKLEEEADCCLACGTSMSGMSVERVATSCADRHVKSGGKQGQGLALVTLQQTPVDSRCALRIFDTCDDFMLRVAEKLGIIIDVKTDFRWNTGKPHAPRRPLTKSAKEAEQRMKALKAKLDGGNSKPTPEKTVAPAAAGATTSSSGGAARKPSISGTRSRSRSRSPSTTKPRSRSRSRSPSTTAKPMRF